MFILDIETTGLDPKIHAPISAGIVDFSNPIREPLYLEFRAWEGAQLDPEAMKLNGFTEDEALHSNQHSLKDAVDIILDYINTCKIKVPAGLNIGRLDIPMMFDACNRVGRVWDCEKRS